MKPFSAFRIHLQDGKPVARFEQLTLADLAAGEVVIRVSYSDVNYKDALAASGTGKVLRRYPLVAGIDLSGIVESSSDERFRPGDRVLVTGGGLSETHDGGYAEVARVPGDWVIPMPAGIDERAAMAFGTAGFTAALAIHRMEENGQRPQAGPVVVTGATGGVGSIAVDILAARGYEVVAVTGKTGATDYLSSLGAAQILARREIDYGKRPLESVCFAGAIDNVGGQTLAWLTRTVGYGGNIASVGLAAGAELQTTVMPFILRGINLLGINSSATPRELRLTVWRRIASDLPCPHLATIAARTIAFRDLPQAFAPLLAGALYGRTVVRIG